MVGDVFKAVRLKSGLSINKFAEPLNVSHQQISRIEANNSVPGYETLKALITEYNVDPYDLFEIDRPARENTLHAAIDSLTYEQRIKLEGVLMLMQLENSAEDGKSSTSAHAS